MAFGQAVENLSAETYSYYYYLLNLLERSQQTVVVREQHGTAKLPTHGVCYDRRFLDTTFKTTFFR